MVSHHGALSGEAFSALSFFFKVGKWDEEGKVGVLMASLFEIFIKLLLDVFPESVAPRLDDHASARF